MKKLILSRCFALSTALIFSVSSSTAQDSINSSFFRDVLHNGSLVHYLEGLNDYVIYEGMHSGQWSDADQLIMSVNGNPYYANKYYVDGFRVDSRLQTGSTLYVPNMEHTNLALGVSDASVMFTPDSVSTSYAQLSANVGNVGRITRGTSDIVHIFHRTGWEGAYKPWLSIPNRQHVKDAFTFDMVFNTKSSDNNSDSYRLYATYGRRALPWYDSDGLLDASPLYSSDYFRAQAEGSIGMRSNCWMDRLSFIFDIYAKGDFGSEFYYNKEEQAHITTISTSVYGSRKRREERVVAGLTYSANRIRHHDLSFSRNIVDQDGESFEPWYADGTYHELSLSVSFNRRLFSWLSLDAELYDSYIRFSSSSRKFSNDVFFKPPTPLVAHFKAEDNFLPSVSKPLPLYRYEWTSRSFGSSLLENRFGLAAEKLLPANTRVRGSAYFTLDGMLLSGGKSKLSPNVKADVSILSRPLRWLELGLTLSHDRISYTLDNVRFLSNDYLNGNIFSTGSGTLLATTGGKYHCIKPGLRQMGYFSLDMPIVLHFGKGLRHELRLVQTYRKYHNVWMTHFADGAAANGFYDDNGVFFMSPGEKHYVVDNQSDGVMGQSFFKRTPYYFSQLSRYTYNGKKVYFSISWQSMQLGCLSGLGNGPASNNVGVLSESTANPNTQKVEGNPGSKYAAAGRADQDRAYVCRIFFSYNVSKLLSFGFLAKWTDGQAFTDFRTYIRADGTDSQVAVVPGRSRGTNPIDHNFGSRENALFNVDAHLRLNWSWRKRRMSFTVQCYNIIDFGNSVNEYCFNTGLNDNRADMALNIPRGLLMTYKVEL